MNTTRPIALGRRNWLQIGTDKTARRCRPSCVVHAATPAMRIKSFSLSVALICPRGAATQRQERPLLPATAPPSSPPFACC